MKHYHKVILLCISLAAALCISEWYIRTQYPQLTLEAAQSFSFNCFEEGEHRWIKLAANKTCELKSAWNAFPPIAIQTNSIGLRNREVSMPKPANTKRIVFVGDSFTMGWGVNEEDTFVRTSETLLNKQGLAFPIETVNAGFSAAGPSGYYIYLKYFGLDLDPDVVVVGFFIGNDITGRTDVEWIQKDANGMPDVVRSKTTYIDWNGALRFKDTPIRYSMPVLNNSHAFLLLANTINPLTTSTDPSKELVTLTSCLFRPECHDLDTAKSEVKFLFEGIQELVESKGKKLVVVMIPDDYQFNTYPAFRSKKLLPLLPSERMHVNNEFASFFESEGIDYIDLLPIFLEQAKEQLYIPDDGHWNAAGHAFAASIISEKLAKILQEKAP